MDFTVEVRERYGDIVADRWPVSVSPHPDELLSSWLHRLAIANGVPPRSFGGILGLGGGMWSARLDLRIPRNVITLLHDRTGVPTETISAMTFEGSELIALLLPLRKNGRRTQSTWVQFCPKCLAADETPYFRRQWRLATHISCVVHGSGLRDRCPSCRSAIISFDQAELIAQHYCGQCGFDLRSVPTQTVNMSARRLERCIDDICRLEGAKGSLTNGDLISRLLRAPSIADVQSVTSLTGLSSSARVRCFAVLAEAPNSWLAPDQNTGTTRWRRSILAAGGHGNLIGCLVDIMENPKRPLGSRRIYPRVAVLPEMIEAYARLISGTRVTRRGANSRTS